MSRRPVPAPGFVYRFRRWLPVPPDRLIRIHAVCERCAADEGATLAELSAAGWHQEVEGHGALCGRCAREEAA